MILYILRPAGWGRALRPGLRSGEDRGRRVTVISLRTWFQGLIALSTTCHMEDSSGPETVRQVPCPPYGMSETVRPKDHWRGNGRMITSLISYKEGVTATEESEARLGEMRHDRLLLMVNDLSFPSHSVPFTRRSSSPLERVILRVSEVRTEDIILASGCYQWLQIISKVY